MAQNPEFRINPETKEIIEIFAGLVSCISFMTANCRKLLLKGNSTNDL